MRYAYAVYKTADSSTTLQISNRVIVEHHEQLIHLKVKTLEAQTQKTLVDSMYQCRIIFEKLRERILRIAEFKNINKSKGYIQQ
jgi:hypothetical protein